MVLWLVEPSTFIGAGETAHHRTAETCEYTGYPCNQQDRYGKEQRKYCCRSMHTARSYDFAEIVPVSARNGDNTDELVKVIFTISSVVGRSSMMMRHCDRSAGASDCGRTDPGKGTALPAGGNSAWNRCGDRSA